MNPRWLSRVRLFGAWLCLAGLLAVAITANGRSLLVLLQSGLHTGPDNYAAAAQAARCMQDALPPYGVVGYIFRADGSSTGSSGEQEGFRYFLTQYYLVPRVLEQSAANEWLVANLVYPDELDQVPTRLGVSLVKQCAQGSAVFRRNGVP